MQSDMVSQQTAETLFTTMQISNNGLRTYHKIIFKKQNQKQLAREIIKQNTQTNKNKNILHPPKTHLNLRYNSTPPHWKKRRRKKGF